MSTRINVGTRSAATPAGGSRPFSLEPLIRLALKQPQRELQDEFFGGFADEEGELTGARLTAAVQANRRLARQLGWGCVVGGVVQPIQQLRTLLTLGASPTEEDLARAVETFQRTVLRQTGDGQLGKLTWAQMLRRTVIPATTFAPFSRTVTFGGRTLGVLEKTRAYERCFFGPDFRICRATRNNTPDEFGGAIIELGFRVTDMDAVRRAGFIDGAGEDRFRWIQVVEFVTVPAAASPTGFVRRASRVIDPTALVEDAANLDRHPYYWDEVTAGTASPDLHIRNFMNRQGTNNLCYDLIFEDVPKFPLSVAQPGRRAYFNFELALVGVRPGPPIQNFILNTVRWGYDLVVEGGNVNVKLNGLQAGTTGGSPAFRRVLSRDFAAGAFPGHCLVGSGFPRGVRCA